MFLPDGRGKGAGHTQVPGVTSVKGPWGQKGKRRKILVFVPLWQTRPIAGPRQPLVLFSDNIRANDVWSNMPPPRKTTGLVGKGVHVPAPPPKLG